MYINRNIFNPGLATKLVLYADPYYSVLPSDEETIDLIAVIKDANGNTKIDWSGENIGFTIESGSELGSLPGGAGDGVDTNNGIAQTIFTPSGYEIDEVVQQGDVVIKASVELPDDEGTISDTITITVTVGVVRIALNADPTSIDANGIITSTVTATLVDAGGWPVTLAPNKITFNISGEGTFVDSAGLPYDDMVEMPNSGGTATIYVKPIYDTPGVATVIASSEGLLSDTVNIVTTGDATSISVSLDHDLIYTDDTDGATVTVEIQDINGNPVEYGEDISLTISGGTGTFEDNPVGPASAYSTFFHPTSSGLIIITASGVGLTAGSATIEVRAPLIADTISLSAIPKNILAGGFTNSIITATIKDGSTVISNYSNDVTFEIVTDTSDSQNASLLYDSINYGTGPLDVPGGDVDNGEAVVYLSPSDDVGICTIKVSTYNLGDPIPIENTVEVGFYSSEDHIELSAVPSRMLVEGDNCTVTAIVKDENGITVDTYNEDITFTILVGWPKIVKFAATGTSSLTTTMVNGEITVDLIPQKEAGTVTLKASSFTGMTDITGYLNIPVDTTLINLVEDSPAYSSTGTENIVTFNIDVQGAEIILEEMKVSWSESIASEILNKIDIGGTVVYSNGDGVVSGTVVDIGYTNLPTGISIINLHFNVGEDIDMSGKTFNIIFYPSSGNYPVEFVVPST